MTFPSDPKPASKAGGQLLTIDDVAERLNIHKNTVRRQAAIGALPRPIKIGNSIRWRPSDIERWIQEGGGDG